MQSSWAAASVGARDRSRGGWRARAVGRARSGLAGLLRFGEGPADELCGAILASLHESSSEWRDHVSGTIESVIHFHATD